MAAANAEGLGLAQEPQRSAEPKTPPTPADLKQAATREQRMQWWHDAKFGMFIHFGTYSLIGRQEWAREMEGTPTLQYELLAKHFNPKPTAAREWARLAKRAGQKYMVFTTKHHEGFCNFGTKLTDYNAVQQGPGRDLVAEYVEAARAEGMRVGFYYSLMDWHHPDGATCKTDEAARKRFVEYTHGLIREILTNYGKVDILWYDMSWPLTPEEWEAEKMNAMVFDLQPEIIVNNRNRLEGDFTTPEQRIQASEAGRAWESCMTLNNSWGYCQGDDDWKTPKTIANNLAICARGGGNYLLNIGPMADGSVPPQSVAILDKVGEWLQTNGKAIYGTQRAKAGGTGNATFTTSGNNLYICQYAWPGRTEAAEWLTFYQPQVVLSIGGMKTKALSARLLKTGQKVEFTQDEFNLRLTGLPSDPPDDPISVIEVECDGVPEVSDSDMRPLWPRGKVGMSV
jgi:alpha-L-fucosidase